jgi:hypothetical protein
VFHPVPYRDPLRPGAALVTPGWLLRAAQDGARRAGAPMPVGDPLIPWLYQPAVRLFRVNLYGDDLSFAQARLPAVFVSDSSFTRFYPWYHKPADTRDKLDAGALARMGQGVLGALDALQRVERGPAQEPTWFAAFERVFDARMVLGAATLSLVPGLLVCLRLGGLALTLRLIQAAAFGSLLWRHPVPAVAVFLLPNLLTAFSTRLWTLVGLLPLVALAAIGADAWRQGAVSGIWLAPWEMIAAGSALVLLWLRPRPAGTRSRAGRLRGRASGAGRRGRSAS